MTQRKGIILAGDSGTRLCPITKGVSKQLLPIYDGRMVCRPISVRVLTGIRESAMIATRQEQKQEQEQEQFKRRCSDGSQWGIDLTHIVQPSPDGLADARSAMCLGDKIFFGHDLPELPASADPKAVGGTVFGDRMADPKRSDVVAFETAGRAREIIEKPVMPPSNYA